MAKTLERKEVWKHNKKTGKLEAKIVSVREFTIEEASQLFEKTKKSLKELQETLRYYKWFDKAVRKAMASAPSQIKERLKEELNNFDVAIKSLSEEIKRKKEAFEYLKKFESLFKEHEKNRDSKSIG